ncbi:TrkH family potassium uptake protein [Corynebacterium sp. p3-SID1145]|uniref:TrkH family potassium uptake protein n=1 Tax=unclassified Corynebacterium TaxID=2624378 RepID=UPI0021AADF35|nr:MULTISPECIES: potassium transporter TrkG [unclassified Corynebacterium]MCT1452950.1 TrkH family potassium uptake protein [Corynebacterium sp. p3-SID1145]MCT1461977.1 TrkH family potassium uptake protein [Corynebacterium sp. p3-SID1140]
MNQASLNGLFSPARLTVAGFLLLILLGTGVLMLPISAVGDEWTPFLPAFFTATSAVSLTGLVVEDTGTYWKPFGQAVILLLIQLGGMGIMSLASLSGMIITGKVSLRARRTGAAEGRPMTDGGVRRTLIFTLLFTVTAETAIAAVLTLRFFFGYHHSFGRSVWEGVFHAVSAFNNAGFSTESANLVPFAADAWILLPIAAALIGGGIGYPVWAEVASRVRHRTSRARKLSLTARITFVMTAVFLAGGMVFIAFAEWNGLLGSMPVWQKLLNAFFSGATPRTAGFNSVDYGDAHPITLMGTDLLMFVGGGSAGTAGGIKVTTAAVLIAAMASEFQGREETTAGKRHIPDSVGRQALALTFAGAVLVTSGVAALRIFDPALTGDQIAFEVFSAFGTAGLSTGITASLSPPSQVVLCLLMYLGRIGSVTLVAALASNSVNRRFSYPEERPFIG